jgi:YggT family protein
MPILAAIFDPIIQVITGLMTLMAILIIIRALLSFFTVDRYHPLYRGLVSVTEPVLAQARRLPHVFGGFDLSAIYAVIGLRVLSEIITNLRVVLLHPHSLYY